MVAGTIYNTIKLQTLDNKWQQKKDNGNILSRKELNERENWTEADWLKHDFEDQLEKNKESQKKAEIDNKIMSGETLTPEEEQYLEKTNPQAFQEYKNAKYEKKSYENKLRNCKTKDEVYRLKHETLNGYLSAFKKIENNPNIPLGEKLAKAQQMVAKTKNISDAEKKFMLTVQYSELPTESEESKERANERDDIADKELVVWVDDADEKDNAYDADGIESNNSIETEIMDTYSKIRFENDLEESAYNDFIIKKSKSVGSKIDTLV